MNGVKVTHMTASPDVVTQFSNSLSMALTHCGPVMPYGDIDTWVNIGSGNAVVQTLKFGNGLVISSHSL